MVVEQAEYLCMEPLIKVLTSTLLNGFDLTQLDNHTPQELAAIKAAMDCVSVVALTDDHKKGQQKDNAKWFGAKWAKKIMKKVQEIKIFDDSVNQIISSVLLTNYFYCAFKMIILYMESFTLNFPPLFLAIL